MDQQRVEEKEQSDDPEQNRQNRLSTFSRTESRDFQSSTAVAPELLEQILPKIALYTRGQLRSAVFFLREKLRTDYEVFPGGQKAN